MKEKRNYTSIMHEWFKHLWDIRSTKITDEYTGEQSSFVRCFECNKLLREENHKEVSITYSHILSKKKYPELAGNEENVVLCCSNCHHLYEMNPKAAKKQYSEKQRLKEKYGII